MNRLKIAAIAVFLVSGFSGLVYQVAWMRMLKDTFGSGSFAIAATISVFFTGLALGNRFIGPWADRIDRPVTAFGLSQIAIGLLGICSPALFRAADDFFLGMAGSSAVWIKGFAGTAGAGGIVYPGPLSFNSPLAYRAVLQLILSFALLLPATTIMGGTLPLLGAGLVRRGVSAAIISTLYAYNTAGAVLGCFTCGFFLIRDLGISGSIYLAALLNLACGAVMLLFSRREPENMEPPIEHIPPPADDLQPGGARFPISLIYGLSGFLAIAYEVGWSRMLSNILGHSTYAFASVLTLYLTCISAGAAIFSRRAAASSDPGSLFARLMAWTSASASLSCLVYLFLQHGSTAVNLSGPEKMAWKFLLTAVAVVPATFLLGCLFPVAVECVMRQGTHSQDPARQSAVGALVGRLLAANTLGGVFGPLAFGFVALPLMGVVKSLSLFASLHLALAAWSARFSGSFRGMLLPIVIGATSAAIMVFAGGNRLSFTSDLERPGARTLFSRDDSFATVKVYENPDKCRFVSATGFTIGSDTDPGFTDMQFSLGQFSLLALPATGPVLVIGYGVGHTSATALAFGVQTDSIEIVPSVVEASRFFEKVNRNCITNPLHRLFIGDGADFTRTSRQTYSRVIVGMNSPRHAGNGTFYTSDYYRDAQRSLDGEGAFLQWIPTHHLSVTELKIVLRTLVSVFPEVTLWFTPAREFLLAMAMKKPLRIDWKRLDEIFSNPGEPLAGDLERAYLPDPEAFLACYIAGTQTIRTYCGSGEIHTENNPILEFFQGADGSDARPSMLEFDDMREGVSEILWNMGSESAQVISRIDAAISEEAVLLKGVEAFRRAVLSGRIGGRTTDPGSVSELRIADENIHAALKKPRTASRAEMYLRLLAKVSPPKVK